MQSVAELLELQAAFRQRLNALNHSEADIEALEKTCGSLYKELVKQASDLTKRRNKAAEQFEKQMIEILIPQGLPHACFKVLISASKELTETGADSVSFLFSANKNGTLQPISQVASGGEISRVMLSVKA